MLEKWMTPSLFTGTTAVDEYSLCQELGVHRATDLLTRHRDSFITEADFAWIASHGLNAVRLPLGHWVFGDAPPYVRAIAYIDKAFAWAKKYNLGIILDLHGAPGSQNGRDHSGRVGAIDWGVETHQQQTLQVYERLAQRYRGHPQLLGIELLNEPSYTLGRRSLRNFYEQAYGVIRSHCDARVAIIFHDAFRPTRWKKLFKGPSYKHALIDHHYYQVFGWRDRHRSMRRQLRRPRILAKRITKLQKSHPVIIGEWSLALPNKTKKPAPENVPQSYATAQLRAMTSAAGWFFWSYKTEGGGVWSYRDCVQRGWLPAEYPDRTGL